MGAIKGSFFFFSWQPAISKTILLRLKARIRDLLSISSFLPLFANDNPAWLLESILENFPSKD